MKARNERQRRVEEANKLLPPVSAAAVKWAYNHCGPRHAYRQTNWKVTCMDCGQTWKAEGSNAKEVRCPQCGRKLKVIDTMKRTAERRVYFSTLTTCRGLQVQRIFVLTVKHRRGTAATYKADELARYWIFEDGHAEVTARQRLCSYYYDLFAMNSAMELRKDKDIYHWLADCDVYTRYKVLPKLRRNGMVGDLPNVSPLNLIKALLTDCKAETMMKARRFEALEFFIGKNAYDWCWPSLKVVWRNGYKIDDYGLWYDYVKMLHSLNKDIRNVHYLCPYDLCVAHDKAKAMCATVEQRRREEERRRKAIEDERLFKEAKARFFGISFTDGVVVVSVLDSVAAYYEGEAMRHCVAQCEYYKKPDSLVLSARVNGERVETVEVSLSTFKVVQSRGVCNRITPYHKEIIELVENNVELIRKAI